MDQQHGIPKVKTFFDLLNHVESSLQALVPEFRLGLGQIQSDFKVEESDSYIRTHRAIGHLQDLVTYLEYLRSARNSSNDVTINLPLDLATMIEVSAENLQETVESAASVFNGLNRVPTSIDVDGEEDFIAGVLKLAGRAMMDAAEKEASCFRRVATLVRQEQGERFKHNHAIGG